ncbi:phosphatidate cytidylyltransferase [Paenibacillus chartarius]|uniref:Phosphatidate cytidylyltransferase n=1 Tax=Paenibacillus chartarius TaxID=747481 RepID=A0ABV6DP06_9BACL
MKQRIMTGAIAGAVFVALIVIGGYWYAALIMLLSIVGYLEYVRMIGLGRNSLTSLFGLAAAAVIAAPWSLFDWLSFPYRGESVLWLLLFGLLALTVWTKNRITIDQAALVFFGVVYLGFGFHYMIETRLHEQGLFWTLLVYGCIWITDSAAYFVGSKLGKHPLWPAISPKKSVEGAVAGVVASIAAALLFAGIRPDLVTVFHAVQIGLVIGIVGQLGDLMQSAYKRVKGIKDTGAILPGHGGVLDRVDSWLIVFPFLHVTGLLQL